MSPLALPWVSSVTKVHLRCSRSLSVLTGLPPDMCHPLQVIPDEAEPGIALPSCVNPHTIRMCPIHGPFGATFSEFHASSW